MKNTSLFKMVLLLLFLMMTYQTAFTAQSFYDYSAETIQGDKIDFKVFKGKPVLIVNTASKCGFTSQYEGLEALYQKYKEKGFTVLAFPSNDFASQEPGTNEEILKFCKRNYGVSFPVFKKGPVKGDQKQALFKFLTESNPEERGEIKWNFEKFIIDSSGQVSKRFRSFTKPTSTRISSELDKYLIQKKSTL